MWGAKVFVSVIFAVLGASFIASTALFLKEFGAVDPVRMLLVHSHIYLFFPLFGILALAAFWLPAVVFTDMYWRYTANFGPLRFCAGFVAVAVISAFATDYVQGGDKRGIWEVAPRVLAGDRAEAVPCGGPECRRGPILDVLASLREESRKRVGLSKFSRACNFDSLLEPPGERDKPRYCFPALSMLDADACCKVQDKFREHLLKLYQSQPNLSQAAQLDAIFMYLKTFFIVVVLVIGALLVIRRHTLDLKYHDQGPAIERCLLMGAAGLLVWPMMDYAYQQASLAMFGRQFDGPSFRLSLVIAPWFLAVLFYFLNHMGRKIERFGQAASVLASSLALYRYEEANDLAVRAVGSGAPEWVIWVMGGLVILGLIGLRFPSNEVLARHRRRRNPPPPAWT